MGTRPNFRVPFDVSRGMPLVTFDRFTLDTDTGELRREGIEVPLEPQPARLLSLLVTRPGALVTRDEAIACLWGDTRVSFADGLHYSVRCIRVALGDDARAPRFVQTVPRRGFRFVGAVARTQRPQRRRWALAAACAALLVAEALPNRHHESVVWVLETLHDAIF